MKSLHKTELAAELAAKVHKLLGGALAEAAGARNCLDCDVACAKKKVFALKEFKNPGGVKNPPSLFLLGLLDL
jgi:hypothetical protein